MLKMAILIVLVLGSGFMIWVRLAKDDPVKWHVDPLTASRAGKMNRYVLLPEGKKFSSPVFPQSAPELATDFDKMALAQSGVTRLAGSIDDLWITYVQRSKLMGYPDYISVRFLDTADGSATLAIYARSRFGKSDFGVNRTRIEQWIKALGQDIVTR